MSAPMGHVNNNMSANELAAQTAQVKISNTDWLDGVRTYKVDKVRGYKELCIGNCRLLYGSERFKFYDVVICNDEPSNMYCAVLTCNQDGQTKLLRTVSGPDAVVATRQLVEGLQKDTAKLFYKYAAGSQLEGQQGYTNPVTGKFELSNHAVDRKIQGPVDDTAGLVRSWTNAPGGAPRGPRGNKRRAPEQLERSQVAQTDTTKNEEGQMDTAKTEKSQVQGDVLNYD